MKSTFGRWPLIVLHLPVSCSAIHRALLHEARQQLRVMDSYVSGFLADHRRLAGRIGKDVLNYPGWRRFCPPSIKRVLSANAWLSTCGSTWGLTVSSIYCAVRPWWMSSPACVCRHIPIHWWISLQRHYLEQCTRRKGALNDKLSASHAEVDMFIIIR